MVPRPSHTAAANLLATNEPVLAKLVEAVGTPRFAPPQKSHFAALVRSVIYQQLAGRAAASIHGKLLMALEQEVTPEAFLALSPEIVRAAGLSTNKARSLTELASKALDGTIDLEPRRLARASDEEVITRLSAVRGIGRWTSQMFLMFQLRRLDVWPTGDLGVRRGYGLAWGLPMPSERELETLGETLRPYRSIAAWYCWRACELYGVSRASALTK